MLICWRELVKWDVTASCEVIQGKAHGKSRWPHSIQPQRDAHRFILQYTVTKRCRCAFLMHWPKLRVYTRSTLQPILAIGSSGKRTTQPHQRAISRFVATMPRQRGQRKPAAEKKPPLTHFLCLPLVTAASKPQLERSIRSFRDDVSPDHSEQIGRVPGEPTNTQGSHNQAGGQIHPKAIRPVGALHCTLGVMSLNEEKLDEAINVLKTIDIEQLMLGDAAATGDRPVSDLDAASSNDIEAKYHSTQPFTIDLKGLVSMHAPQNTSILYAAPQDPSERLYPLCLALQKIFKEKELLLPDDRKLKLHATLVNTIYAKGKKKPQAKPDGNRNTTPSQSAPAEQPDDRSQGHGPNAKAPLKIDAREVLEKYKDFAWAENFTLDRVAICEMGAKKKTDPDGNAVGEEYIEVANVSLPS